MLASLIFFVVVGLACYTIATAVSKKGVSAPAFLSQSYLQGSMQGKSGAALDLNGGGHQDLVVGAPCVWFKSITGAVLAYHATDKGFPKHPSAVLKGDGNFCWSLVSLGDVKGDGIPDLAVSAVHADGKPWPMTGKIFIFSGSTLTTGTAMDSAIAIPGEAKDMHLGAFLAFIKERMWLVPPDTGGRAEAYLCRPSPRRAERQNHPNPVFRAAGQRHPAGISFLRLT